MNYFRKNNTGAALLTVIIIVSFLAIIGVIVLSMASNYVVSTSVSGNSQDNFYETEAITEEIRSGLSEVCQDAGKSAYEYCIEHYGTLSESKMNAFAKRYFSTILDALSGTSFQWEDESKWIDDVATINSSMNTIKAMTQVPDAVDTTNVCKLVINRKNGDYKLTLKDLKINNITQGDYETTIKTDIVLTLPDYHLDGNTTMDEIKKYIVISDDSLDITKNGLDIYGNIYSGTGGTHLSTSTAKVNMNGDTIISRGDLSISSGAQLILKNMAQDGLADLWVENIETKEGAEDSTLETILQTNANHYVSDDLNIQSNYSNINLSGNYYGYNFNRDNSETLNSLNDKFSSAIIINGLNCSLNMENIERMTLAGRAFIERKDSSDLDIDDIMMGESLGVKSDQIAYMVPKDCIQFKHNPVFRTEYDSVDASTIVDKEKLLSTEKGLSTFLNQEEPYVENFNSHGYVFYFLNFKNEDCANEYYKQFYTENKTKLYNKAISYIAIPENGDSNILLSPALYLLAGNIVKNYDLSENTKMDEANYFDEACKPKTELLKDGSLKASMYMGMQLSLLPSSSFQHFDGDDKTKNPLISSKILNTDKLTDGTYPSNLIHDKDTTLNGYAITVSTTGTSTITSSTPPGIYIAKGDVTVSSNFEGLVLATGKVTVTGAATMKSNQVVVRKLLDEAAKDSTLKEFFKDMNETDGDSVDYNKCIAYTNWSKNAD